MKILIIGGTRFLGLHIAEDLCKRGHDVELLNRGSRPAPECVAHSHVCDVRDRQAFSEFLASVSYDVVIDTIMMPADLAFAIPLLDRKIKHFIHTGSLGVYGGVNHIPASESEVLVEHEESYNFSDKLREDNVLMDAFTATGFPATSLRASCIYGPGDVPLDGWGGRSVHFFERLRDGAEIPIAGWGNYLLHTGHVHDLGRAFGDAVAHPESIGRIYNIAGPYAMTVKDYIEEIARAMGAEGHVVSNLEDVGEALEKACAAQDDGKTTILEVEVTQELGDPFRRDALKYPARMLDKYKHTDVPEGGVN